jgi:hypothetical protein
MNTDDVWVAVSVPAARGEASSEMLEFVGKVMFFNDTPISFILCTLSLVKAVF